MFNFRSDTDSGRSSAPGEREIAATDHISSAKYATIGYTKSAAATNQNSPVLSSSSAPTAATNRPMRRKDEILKKRNTMRRNTIGDLNLIVADDVVTPLDRVDLAKSSNDIDRSGIDAAQITNGASMPGIL